jgi:hypothetical protein
MNRYEPNFPRATFGFSAMAMTAITICVLVVLPSQMEPSSQAFAMLAASSSAATDPCAAMTLKCVDPTAIRESTSMHVSGPGSDPKCKEQS